MPKISALPGGVTPSGVEVIPAVQAGGTVGLTIAQILTSATTIAVAASASAAAALVYTPLGTGAVATTVAGKLGQVVSVFDFLTAAQQANVSGNLATLDVTTPFQAAATYVGSLGGGILYLPPGTYMINQMVKLSSNTILAGCGVATTILANPTYVGIAGVSYATHTSPLIGNANFAASSLTDHDICVRDVNFSWGAVTIAGGGAHSISFRFVNRITVYNVSQIQAGIGPNGENVTSFISCQDTNTQFCRGINCTNAYFDDWGGTGSARVIGCVGRTNPAFAYWNAFTAYVVPNVVVYKGVFYTCSTNNTNSQPPSANWTTGGTAVTTAQGIQFSGLGSFSDAGQARNAVVAFCELYGIANATGTASAYIANAVGATSSSARYKTFGNYAESCDNGHVFSGAIGQGQSTSDVFNLCNTGVPIFIGADVSGSPSNCRVFNPTLIDCNHIAGANALATITTGANNRIEGINVFSPGGVQYANIAYIQSGAANCFIGVDKAPSGTGGVRVVNASTTSVVIDRDDLDAQVYAGGGGGTPNIASTGTIAPLVGRTFITGANTISTITVPNGCIAGGKIILIPSGGSSWVTSTSGNIGAASTSVVGKQLIMEYDGTTSKWYPSY